MTKVNAPLGKEKPKKNESPVEQRLDGIYEKSTGRKIVSPLDVTDHAIGFPDKLHADKMG